MSTSAPLVYVSVVTFNGRRFLDGCFRALRKTAYNNFGLALIDNGGSDGSGQFVAGAFPEVEVVRVFPNAGYARGENAAIRKAIEQGAEYVVVCNDDIQTIDDRWLAEAVRAAEQDKRVGIVGFTEVTSADAALTQTVEASDTTHVVGFALFLRVSMLQEIGLFDEAYFVFGDEDDLAARAALAGYRLLRLNIPVLHFGGGTAPRRSRKSAYLQMRNGLRFCIKNRGPLSVFLRAARILDVACSPWPLSACAADAAHLRMRNTGNVLVNLALLTGAIAWNGVALPWTLRASRRDRRRCRAASEALSRLANSNGNRSQQPNDDAAENGSAKRRTEITFGRGVLCGVTENSNHPETSAPSGAISAAETADRRPETER